MEEVKSFKNKQPSKAHMMESYAEDMASVISDNTGGLVQKIIHEQEEREMEKKDSSPYSNQNKFFLFISILFVFSAIGLFGYYFIVYNPSQTINVAVPLKSLIISDETVFVDISGLNKNKIAEKIIQQKNSTKIKQGQLESIYFSENKKVIGWERWNDLIKSNFQQGENPIFNDNFVFGITSVEITEPVVTKPVLETSGGLLAPDSLLVSDNTIYGEIADPLRYAPEKPTRKDLIMLLSVKSFADVFPIMQSWENKMFFDLYEIFGIDIKADNNYLLTKDWEDGIVQNKNARILYDKEANIVLMYVYADNNYIIVATTEESVREIMERLVASKVRK